MQGKEGGYIIMTRAPGDRLDTVLYRMTVEERSQLSRDLGRYIAEWRRIPNPQDLISTTLGGRACDHAFEGKECGPFRTTTEFAGYLTEGLDKYRRERPLSGIYKEKHRVYFTHSDLHQTNIFVQQGRLSCVIDWEHAGFKPEYWEYTRALWAYWGRRDQKEPLCGSV